MGCAGSSCSRDPDDGSPKSHAHVVGPFVDWSVNWTASGRLASRAISREAAVGTPAVGAPRVTTSWGRLVVASLLRKIALLVDVLLIANV